MIRYLGTAVVTIAVTLSAAAANAAGSTEFGEPDLLGRGTEPRIAVNASGTAVALWRHRARGVLEAAVRTRGVRWSAPSTVGRTGTSRYEGSPHAALAVDPRGDAVVVWLGRRSLSRAFVMAARRPHGGRWSRPHTLAVIRDSDNGLQSSETQTTPAVRFDAAGNAIAVWSRFVAGFKDGYRVQAAIGTPDGAWSQPQVLGTADIHPAFDLTPAGDAIVVWPEATFASGMLTSSRLVATTRPVGGSWSPLETVMSGESTPVGGGTPSFDTFFSARVVLRADGTATALWKASQIPAAGYRLETATRSPAGTWSPPETLDARADVLSSTFLRAPVHGGATAVWLGDRDQFSGVDVVRATEQGPDGHWSLPVVSLSRSDDIVLTDAALSPSGHLVVLVTRPLRPSRGTHYVLDAYVRTPEDGWMPAHRLAGPAVDYRRSCQSARLAFSDETRGLVIRSCGAGAGRGSRVTVQSVTSR